MRAVRVDLTNPRHVNAFLSLPRRIYERYPLWTPPLTRDIRRALDRSANPFFAHSDAAFFLAVDESRRVVGRVCVHNDRRLHDRLGTETAFFHLFECEDSPDAAQALFDATWQWARNGGLNKLEGSRGFGLTDGLGILVRGFEQPPAYGSPYNPPYYAALLEGQGFSPSEDISSGYVDRRTRIDPKIHSVARRMRSRGYDIAAIRSRRDLRRWVDPLLDLYNRAVEEVPDGIPLTEEDAKATAREMLWFAEPDLVKILLHEDEPVGFALAYPDITEGLRAANGALLPLGWARLLWSLRTTPKLNVNGIAITGEHRSTGGMAVLASALIRSLERSRYDFAEFVQVGSDNALMQRFLRRIGVDWQKVHRMYAQDL